jgi:hypothetical protein
MDFLNDEGQVSGLDFEGIPDFIREYLKNYAKPLTVQAPELSMAFQLFAVIEDLDGILDGDLEPQKAMPLLFVLWTNLIARMARIETILSAQDNLDALMEDEDVEEEDQEEWED